MASYPVIGSVVSITCDQSGYSFQPFSKHNYILTTAVAL